ncbi:hypothetical protein ACHRVY_19140 [Flavobacterium plurextorum]|uniref:hypothetical protein n=1 Tax=Flavobacterium plurextorum TaxID=1114867 RepID=UPI0037577770
MMDFRRNNYGGVFKGFLLLLFFGRRCGKKRSPLGSGRDMESPVKACASAALKWRAVHFGAAGAPL